MEEQLPSKESVGGSNPFGRTKHFYKGSEMARYSSELAVKQIGNRYDLILVAASRARELRTKYMPLVETKSGPTVAALEEIEAGKIGLEQLLKNKK